MRVKFASIIALLLALVIAIPASQGCTAIASYLIYDWIQNGFGDDNNKDPEKPVIKKITVDREEIHVGESVLFEVEAEDDQDKASELDYYWVASAGTMVEPTSRITIWVAPDEAGTVSVSVVVKDTDDNSDTVSINIEVLE
jgi:hypothetical protein